MVEEWQRPASIPFPQVWKRHKGVVEVNGKLPEFWIQDIPEDMYETVIEIMTKNYYASEPMRKCAGFLNDALSVAEGQELWRKALRQRLSLVTYTKDENGNPEIAGLGINWRRTRNESPFTFKGTKMSNIFSLTGHVFKKKDFFEEFNVTEVISDIGGLTLPKFCHQKVGLEGLKCREIVCKAIGIKMAFSLFTSEISQAVAEEAGYTEYIKMTYDELAKIDERFYIPGLHKYARCIKLMYKYLEKSSL